MTYDPDGVSKKFLEEFQEYLPTVSNMGMMISWLAQKKLGLNTGNVGLGNALEAIHNRELWTLENLKAAYEDLAAVGMLALKSKQWKPLDKRPLASANKEIKQRFELQQASKVAGKSIEEVLVACETEMHIHFFMEAQDYLKRAEAAETLDESLILAADGLIALDRSADCGTPRIKALDLEKKLKEVSLRLSWVKK